MLQSNNGAQKRQLHLLRQGGGHALQVVFIRVQPHWLDEQLVSFLVRKADDFVLDGGAVPGANALDSAGIHGGAVQVRPDHCVGLSIGVGDVAADPVLHAGSIAGKRKRDNVRISVLPLQLVKVDAPAMHTAGRTSFEPAQRNMQGPETLRKLDAGQCRIRPALVGRFSHMDQSPQIGSCGNHNSTGSIHSAKTSPNATYGTVFS